jgi:hypothetical protein
MAGPWVLALLLAAQAADGGAARARLDALVEGRGYTTEQLNSRWANSAAAARDSDARSLFWRVYTEQNALHAGDITEAEKEALLRRNSDWLKAVLARIGWFDISRYGREASQAAWLIVQHSDHDPAWQQQVLADLAPRVARGDMQRNYYAYLVDRVAVNAGRPQSYGTQGRCEGPGDLRLFEVSDRDNLDRRRAEMGLESLADYTVRFCGAAPQR